MSAKNARSILLSLFVVTALASILVACGTPSTAPEVRTLEPAEAREVMATLTIAIPETFTLIQMIETRPPLAGSPSYVGAFEGPAGALGQITFGGRPLDAQNTTCEDVKKYLVDKWRDQGFDCGLTGLARLTVNPAGLKTTSLSVLTGWTPAGKGRVFVESAGT